MEEGREEVRGQGAWVEDREGVAVGAWHFLQPDSCDGESDVHLGTVVITGAHGLVGTASSNVTARLH